MSDWMKSLGIPGGDERCAAWAASKGRRCMRRALPEFGTCLTHTTKGELLRALRQVTLL
jgi:hypothetical protein